MTPPQCGTVNVVASNGTARSKSHNHGARNYMTMSTDSKSFSHKMMSFLRHFKAVLKESVLYMPRLADSGTEQKHVWAF